MKPYLGSYILKDGIAVPEPDTRKWAKWLQSTYEKGNDLRRVAKTEIHHCTVSTVFLGLDHGFGESEYPVLFETMVFAGELSDGSIDFNGMPFEEDNEEGWSDMRRYSFMSEALEGHHEVVRLIEKRFGQVQDKVSGLIYGIINAEEWTRETK